MQAAKMSLIWSGENIRKPAQKSEKHISKFINKKNTGR